MYFNTSVCVNTQLAYISALWRDCLNERKVVQEKKDETAFIGFVYLFFCRKRQILKCGAEKWIDFNVIRLLFFANYGSGAINSGSGSLEIDGID